MPVQLRLTLERGASYAREAFTRSPSNAAAVAQLGAWPAWRTGVLGLIGPPGSGKTHLARIWAQRSGAEISSGQADSVELVRSSGPWLLEDADRQSHGEALFHLINVAEREKRGLLITARTPPSAWCAAIPDLRSRLNSLPVTQIHEPDDIVLSAMLEKFFFERNIKPSEELLGYLIRRIERSASSARDIVVKLDEAADAQGRAVSRSLARELLEGEAPPYHGQTQT